MIPVNYRGTTLVHHGVKGMKWGIRKKYYKSHMDSDRVLKKNSEFQNISRNKKRELKRGNPVYTSYTEHDNNAYAGRYASNMSLFGDKPIKNTLVLNNDVKIPSQRKAAELFIDMYNSDPKGMSKSIAKAYASLDWFNGISKIRNWNSDRIENKFQKKGEEWVKTKGYLMFNQSMMSSNRYKARQEYYKLLLQKGYSGIVDINDLQTGYGADDPIIFIRPNKDLSLKSSRALTDKDIEIASARYAYDQARRDRKSFNNIVNLDYPYQTAKKNLKKVEKKYSL